MGCGYFVRMGFIISLQLHDLFKPLPEKRSVSAEHDRLALNCLRFDMYILFANLNIMKQIILNKLL